MVSLCAKQIVFIDSFAKKICLIKFNSLIVFATFILAAQPSYSQEDVLYQVTKGDTLWDLSQKYLGDGSKFSQIHRANAKTVSDADLIFIGQTISIPGARLVVANRQNGEAGKTDSERLFDLEEGLRDGLEVGFEESDALKIALGMLSVPDRVEIVSPDEKQRDMLERSLAAARVLEGVETWHSGIFVSSNIISEVITSLEEVKLNYAGTDRNLKGAIVEISSADLVSQVGSLVATLGIKASRGELSVGLTLTAAIEFARFEDIGGGARNAIFKITPVEIVPQIGFESVSVRRKALWVNITPVVQELFGGEDSFELAIPVPSTHSVEIAIDRETKEVLDEEKNRSITYTTKMKERTIELASTAGAPVFTAAGFYLVTGPVAFGEIGNSLKSVSAEARPIPELAAELKSRVASWGFQEADIEAFVGANFLTSTIEKLGEGPSEDRVINIQSTKVSGKLAEEKWRDDFLGDGGVWAAFAGDNAVRASFSWSNLTTTFSESVLDLSAQLAFNGTADVAFHFDPLIGGGIGTSIGMDTSSGANIRLRATSDFVENGGLSFGYLTVTPRCQLIRADIRSDGKFKVSKSWAKVPSVGARLGIPIGKEPLLEDILLINQSTVIDFGVDPFKVKDWKPDDRAFGAVVSAAPSRFEFGSSGIRAGTNVNISLFAPGTTPLEVENIKRISLLENEDARKIAEQWISDNATKPDCSLDTEIALLLGPVEIGKNNELVKLVTNGINDLWEGLGDGNEVTKAMKNLGIDVGDVGIKDIYQETEERFNKAKERLSKPLKQPGKTIECVVTLFNSC